MTTKVMSASNVKKRLSKITEELRVIIHRNCDKSLKDSISLSHDSGAVQCFAEEINEIRLSMQGGLVGMMSDCLLDIDVANRQIELNRSFLSQKRTEGINAEQFLLDLTKISAERRAEIKSMLQVIAGRSVSNLKTLYADQRKLKELTDELDLFSWPGYVIEMHIMTEHPETMTLYDEEYGVFYSLCGSAWGSIASRCYFIIEEDC